jgi:hypothetical protein
MEYVHHRQKILEPEGHEFCMVQYFWPLPDPDDTGRYR